MESKRHFDTPFQLYHLSEDNHNGKVFYPRPMDKDRVMECENWRVPRICVANSIDGAVSALVDSMSCWYGIRLYVHVPDNLLDLFKMNKVHRPSTNQVPDAEVTGEHWLKAPAKMKMIGQIEVLDIDDSQNLTYLLDGEKIHLDRFRWKWTIRRM